MMPNRQDHCTISNFDDFILKEARLQFEVDFDKNIIQGVARLAFVALRDFVSYIILDMESQKVLSVKDHHGEDVAYFVDHYSQYFNSLKIDAPPFCKKGEIIKYTIKFRTDPKSTGLYWVDPNLSDDGVNPFLFTHTSKTHCRSIFPCQDSLAVKIRYSAEVIVPKNLTVVMSAVPQGCEVIDNQRLFKFNQPHRVSCCWFAMAVGPLKSCKVGPRSTLWGTPTQLTKEPYKLAELENTLILGEQLCGDFPWETANVVLMPSVYPFSVTGHSNCIFMPPDIPEKDIEVTLAKGVAQCWMGPCTSGFNWNHFWINEGFATFLFRKILAKIHGDPLFYLHTCIGIEELRNEVNQLMIKGEEGEKQTKLVCEAKTGRPLAGLINLPSEKSHVFLTFLEQVVDGPAKFEPFIRAFVERYKYKCLNSNEFVVFFNQHFSTMSKVKNINWKQWMYSTGHPWKLPSVNTTLTMGPIGLAESWKSWDDSDESSASTFSSSDLASFSELQVRMFLCHLCNTCHVFPVTKLRMMKQLYNMNQYQDPDVKLKWLLLSVDAKCPEQLQECFAFLEENHQLTHNQLLLRKLSGWKEFSDDILKHYEQQKGKILQVNEQLYENELCQMIDSARSRESPVKQNRSRWSFFKLNLLL